MLELASDLDEQVSYVMNKLEEVRETFAQLTALYPENLNYDTLDDDY
jgi:hypothetical protein